MVFVTGDTHRDIDIHKLTRKCFNYKGLTKNDYIIICGDFGFVWEGEKKDNWWLNWLEKLPCSILWVDGNHENFELLNTYPVEEWHGGKIHKIREHVFHLMRGQVFTIEGKTFFTFGGAESVDKAMRIEFISWWSEELPSYKECDEALKKLESIDWEVDFVITHCAPSNIQYRINPFYAYNVLTNLLFEIDKKLKFKHWYFGHYHLDKEIDDSHTVLFADVKRII